MLPLVTKSTGTDINNSRMCIINLRKPMFIIQYLQTQSRGHETLTKCHRFESDEPISSNGELHLYPCAMRVISDIIASNTVLTVGGLCSHNQ